MGTMDKILRLAIPFLFILTITVRSEDLGSDSHVLAPGGSNPRRLLEETLNNISTFSKPPQENKGPGDNITTDHKGKTNNVTELIPPATIDPENKIPTGAGQKEDHGNFKENSKSDEAKHGSRNKTDKYTGTSPEKPNGSLGPKNGSTSPPDQKIGPPVGNKDSKYQTHNGTGSSPPEKRNEPSVPPKEEKSDAHGEKERDVCDKAQSCTDNKKMVACLRAPGNEMQELSLLIQNKGDDSRHVDIEAPAFLKVDPLKLTLGKGESKLVQVLMADQLPRNLNLSKIVINGGNGECTLDVPNELLNVPYNPNFFEGFPYSAVITPMFGVYFLLFTVVAIGGSWMCCKFRGRRWHGDGSKYQELEMSLPESNLPISAGGKPEAESMDGWDEVWDDSWEDAEAARSSARPIQTLSSKGLAARRSNKDG